MFKRIQNLWRISAIELPKSSNTKTLQEKLKETILGKKKATIVELQEPEEMFPENHETN